MSSLHTLLKFIVSSILAIACYGLEESDQLPKTVAAMKSSFMRKTGTSKKSVCGTQFKEKNATFLFGCEGLTASNPTQTYCVLFRGNLAVYGVGLFSLTRFSASSYGDFFLASEFDGYMQTSFTLWLTYMPVTDPAMYDGTTIAMNGVGYLQLNFTSYLSNSGVYTYPMINTNDCGVSSWKTMQIDWLNATKAPFDALGVMTVYH
jgi:hypothetical protein